MVPHLVNGQNTTDDHLSLTRDKRGHDQAGTITQQQRLVYEQRLKNSKENVSMIISKTKQEKLQSCYEHAVNKLQRLKYNVSRNTKTQNKSEVRGNLSELSKTP